MKTSPMSVWYEIIRLVFECSLFLSEFLNYCAHQVLVEIPVCKGGIFNEMQIRRLGKPAIHDSSLQLCFKSLLPATFTGIIAQTSGSFLNYVMLALPVPFIN